MKSKMEVAADKLETAVEELITAKNIFTDLNFNSTAKHLGIKILDFKETIKLLRNEDE